VPTLAEIVDAVWSTEIQPGLTAREILAAWLQYQEHAGSSSWNQWLQVDFPTGTPRHYRPRFAWSRPAAQGGTPATAHDVQRTRRPAQPSAHHPTSDRASERFAIREPSGGLLPRGLPPLAGDARTRDDEEALILALLMADD